MNNKPIQQQIILGPTGQPCRDMDIELTANSYVQALKALQEFRRSAEAVGTRIADLEDPHLKRFYKAVAEAERLVKGAGFSL